MNLSRLIEDTRPEIVFDLASTFADDVLSPCYVHIAIGEAPSLTKDAISLGLVAGELRPSQGGLQGVIELTALGRLVVRRAVRLTLRKIFGVAP